MPADFVVDKRASPLREHRLGAQQFFALVCLIRFFTSLGFSIMAERPLEKEEAQQPLSEKLTAALKESAARGPLLMGEAARDPLLMSEAINSYGGMTREYFEKMIAHNLHR